MLDVVTVECSAAVLETAEVRRQEMGLRTVGRGPSSADREQAQESTLLVDIDNSATAVQQLAASNFEDVTVFDHDGEQRAQEQYRVNTRDTHRADRQRNAPKHSQGDNNVTKHQKMLFRRKVGVNMDLLDCKPSMESFCFTLLDTMGRFFKHVLT